MKTNTNTTKQTIIETATPDGLDRLRSLLDAQKTNTAAIQSLQTDADRLAAAVQGALNLEAAAALHGELAETQNKLTAARAVSANIEAALRQERTAAQSEGVRCARAAAVSKHSGRYRAAQARILDAVAALRDAVADAEQTLNDAEGEAAPLHAAGVKMFDSLNGLGVRPGSYSVHLARIESALDMLREHAATRPRVW